MKVFKITIFLLSVLMLSCSALAVGGTLRSVKAFYDSEDETEAQATELKMLLFGENAFACVNCPALSGSQYFPVLECKGSCTLYPGFKFVEEYDTNKPEHREANLFIAKVNEYKPGYPVVDKNGVLVEMSQIGNDALIVDREGKKVYKWPEKHIIRLNDAKVTFDNAPTAEELENKLSAAYKEAGQELSQEERARIKEIAITKEQVGRILNIEGINLKELRTAWVDGLGIPLKGGDRISFFTFIKTSEGSKEDYDLARPKLMVGNIGDAKNAKEWLKKLPNALKEDKKSRLTLCGQQFTNYYIGSYFVLSKEGKGCRVLGYQLNTELFDENDKEKEKEYLYECGDLLYRAIGGDIKYISCNQQKEPMLWCKDKCDGNEQKFKLLVTGRWIDWFDIDKNSAFLSVKKSDDGVVFMLGKLVLGEDTISWPWSGKGTKGWGGYGANMEANEIKLLMIGDKGYKGELSGLQLQFQSDGVEIRRSHEGVTFQYIFEAPHTKYIAQLGNDKTKPIIGIWPANYELSKADMAAMARSRDDIPIFGARLDCPIVTEVASLRRCYVSAEKAKPAPEAETKEQTITIEELISLEDFIAKKCFNKEYSRLSKEQQKSVNSLKSEVIKLNPGKIENGYVAENTPLVFPQLSSTVYKKGDKKVTIKSAPIDCPGLLAEAISPKKLPDYCIKGPGFELGECYAAEECAKRPSAEYVERAKNAGYYKECPPSTVCCLEAKEQKARKAKGGMKNDAPCTESGGACADIRHYACLDEKGKSVEYVRGKCLSNPSTLYLCCPTGKVKKIEAQAQDKGCARFGAKCVYGDKCPYGSEIAIKGLCVEGAVCCSSAPLVRCEQQGGRCASKCEKGEEEIVAACTEGNVCCAKKEYKSECEKGCYRNAKTKEECLALRNSKEKAGCDDLCYWDKGCVVAEKCNELSHPSCVGKHHMDEVGNNRCVSFSGRKCNLLDKEMKEVEKVVPFEKGIKDIDVSIKGYKLWVAEGQRKDWDADNSRKSWDLRYEFEKGSIVCIYDGLKVSYEKDFELPLNLRENYEVYPGVAKAMAANRVEGLLVNELCKKLVVGKRVIVGKDWKQL